MKPGPPSRTRSSRIFFGWVVIGGLFITACFGPMGRYILTALFPFLMQDPGWSRQTIGLAFTLHFWIYAFFAILAGKMVDSLGGRATIFLGGFLTLAGLVLLSLVKEIWQFYLVFGVILAAAVSMTHFVPNTALVRKWFIHKAGLATGVVTVGTVIGFAFLPPIISQLSARMGWRSACLIAGGAMGSLIMATAWLLIRNSPESMGLLPDGENPSPSDESSADLAGVEEPGRFTTRQTLRDRNFWYYFLAYSITGIPMQGILGHVIIWGVDLGFPAANSGLILAALTLPSIPVRILAGWLGDRLGKRRVLILFTLYTVAVWLLGWFIITDRWSFIVFILLLGFGYSAPFSLYTPLLGDVFGRRIVGTLMGILTLGHGIIGGLGPTLWGWIADRTGSYVLNCPISAFCYLLVAVCLFLFKVPAKREA